MRVCVCVCVIVWQVDAMITENPLSHILTVRLQHSQADGQNFLKTFSDIEMPSHYVYKRLI